MAELSDFLKELDDRRIAYSIDETRAQDEPVSLDIEADILCNVEIDPDLKYMDVFARFFYEDELDSNERELSKESLANEYTYFFEQCLYSYLQRNTHHLVSRWDDGCFSCYGSETRIGFCRVKCVPDLVKEFVDVVQSFCRESGALSAEELQDILLHELIQHEESNLMTLVAINKKKANTQAVESETVKQFAGEEYCLFDARQVKYATPIDAWRFVLSVIHECEYFDTISFTFYERSMCVNTYSYQITLPLGNYEAAAKIEEINLRGAISRYLPFCDESIVGQMQQIAYNIPRSSSRLKIITEGKTDWKHIKHAFACSNTAKAKGWNGFSFEEFDEKIQMGNDMLKQICVVQAKIKRSNPVIAIFDRDDNTVLQQVTDKDRGFKDWGNHVYSLALPIPEHRKNTPAISIEHYYSDDEIKKEYPIDGILRRLFMGNEFDEFGRAPEIGRMCAKYSCCGRGKIHIIDEKVYDSNSRSNVNYALSKSRFAEIKASESVLSKEANMAFDQLGYKIEEILKFDRLKKRSK